MRPRTRPWWALLALLLLPALALAQPRVHLLTQSAQSEFVPESAIFLNEGAPLRFRAASSINTRVTVRVQVEADATAVAMGYASGTWSLAFSGGLETSPRAQTAGGNSTDESYGTITLTLLPGNGYRVGTPSFVAVRILDDDGDPLTFRDCDDCPEMVAIPGGTFLMGSPNDEAYRNSDEGPQRTVTITPFAAGKYEVTYAEWEACQTAGGCTTDPDEEDWASEDDPIGTFPVVNISWEDAQEYVTWLSEKTGEDYRLLTEAEWEYAARAGSTTRYWWGHELGSGNANCSNCRDE